MADKLDTINVQLPKETVAAIQRIAKLAGVKPETIMKIAIATECLRWADKLTAALPESKP